MPMNNVRFIPVATVELSSIPFNSEGYVDQLGVKIHVGHTTKICFIWYIKHSKSTVLKISYTIFKNSTK